MTAPARIPSPYGTGASAESFDFDRWLTERDWELLGTIDGRRVLTRLDPLLFAMVYLPHLLADIDGEISLADNHLDLCRFALGLVGTPGPRESRHAFISPRESGKSTWLYKIIPLWLAAHGHARFIVAFSSSGTQAEIHLSGVKRELDINTLLRTDYPDLCHPARRPSGANVADTQSMLHTRSGFTFAARGVDSEILGIVDPLNRRPDKILCDDLEPAESAYSEYQAGKRLATLVNAVLPMNERAHVIITGTVTMPGSIVHQLVQATQGEPKSWITDERFEVRHYLPIVTRPDGSERSIWPGKWPLVYLQSIRHTRSYQLNFENNPRGVVGGYWSPDDIRYGDLPDVIRVVMSIDPTETTKTRSDPAGISIVGYAPPRPDQKLIEMAARAAPADRKALQRLAAESARIGRCVVYQSWEVRLVGERLRQFVMGKLAAYPEITTIMVEANKGGENWHSILHHVPVKLALFHESEPKEVRAANLLNHYQRRRVTHAGVLPALEAQQCAFPLAAHDDLVDSVGAVVNRLLIPRSAQGRSGTVYPR